MKAQPHWFTLLVIRLRVITVVEAQNLRAAGNARVCTSCTTGVDKVSTFVLVCIKLMSVTWQKNIDFHLSGSDVQGFFISPGNYLMAVNNTNAERTVSDDLWLRKWWVLSRTRILQLLIKCWNKYWQFSRSTHGIKVAFNNMGIASYGTNVIKGLLVADIASWDNLLYFSWNLLFPCH